jgi:hypothetical protein
MAENPMYYSSKDEDENSVEGQRKMKQLYLIENVTAGGFDTSRFN